LHALCESFVPPCDGLPALAPGLARHDAARVDTAPVVEQVLAAVDPDLFNRVRFFLRLVERPLFGWWRVGRWRGFTSLSPAEREHFLRELGTSRLGPLRSGFQAFKRLATFFAFALPDASGRNPAWDALGYHLPPVPPTTPEPLRITSPVGREVWECDACVIGSGAGGGVAAGVLARAGLRVIVLEAGGPAQSADFERCEGPSFRRLYLDQGLSATTDLSVALLAGGTLGGGTTVNWQTSLRLPDEIRAEWADLSGCPHFTADSFSSSFDAVATRLGVGTEASVVNANNDVLRRGCERLGYACSELPRNARGCDAAQCGFCVFGCRGGGKQSTVRTFLHDAQSLGDTTILTHCRAERILIEEGRATGVKALAHDVATGQTHPIRVGSRIVVVAAGGIHSPALLRRSRLVLPAIGRFLTLHPTTAVLGVYPEDIEPWHGPPQTILCDHFAHLEGAYGFRLEVVPSHPGLIASALPWRDAVQHRRDLAKLRHFGAIMSLTRDRPCGRVRTSRTGEPLVEYRPGRVEQRLLRRGIVEAIHIQRAAGALEVLPFFAGGERLDLTSATDAGVERFCEDVLRSRVADNWCALYSAHQMGTCRMGRDPRTSVCDANGQVHGVAGLYITDASAFPASSGVNPMLTIMALAYHTAQRIVEREGHRSR
jgi:choline dehydrogenase-like flavoprotein